MNNKKQSEKGKLNGKLKAKGKTDKRKLRHLNLVYPKPVTECKGRSRNFDYQLGSKSVLELTGCQKAKIILSPPKDVKQFSNIRLHKQPNTQRTLIPELNPQITTHQRRKSPNGLKFNSTSPEFFYISNICVSPSIRKFIYKYHKCQFLFTDKPQYEKPKSSIRMTSYEKYTHTTQIANLPGGSKRSKNDISDDSQRTFRRCSRTKMVNDYSSNIACLPGSRINISKYKALMRLFTQNRSYDIFHLPTEEPKSHRRQYASFHLNTSPHSTMQTMSGIRRVPSKNKSTLERFE